LEVGGGCTRKHIKTIIALAINYQLIAIISKQ
jgi:hypothetical protein